MPKKRKLTSKQKAMTYQYLNSLKRMMVRVDSNSFDHFNVKIKNRKLAKLLLCIAYSQKLPLDEFVEKLVIERLEKTNKSYKNYFEHGFQVNIKTSSAIHFYQEPRMTTQDERYNPGRSLHDNA